MTVPNQPVDSGSHPYKPSFVDRLMEAVERLPIPYWLTYMMLFILESLLLHLVSWIDGWVPLFSFFPLALLFPLWLWGPLAIMTHLDKVSRESLASFSPLLNMDEEEMKRLGYSFSTMPARMVIVSGIFWIVFYFVLTYVGFDRLFRAIGAGPIVTPVAITVGMITFFTGSAIYYHSIRQLTLVNRVVRVTKQFNLFRLDPVYAFSRLTAQTGIAWVLLLTFTLLFLPLEQVNAPILVLLIGQVLLAIAAFALPLQVVHQRLVAEKRRLLAEVDRRLEMKLSRFHQYIDDNELTEVDQLNSVIAGLNAEREMLNKIPTWPWRAGTLTGLLTAVMLPIVLFLIQSVLGNLLGG